MKLKEIIWLILIMFVITSISILSGALNWINQLFIVGTAFFIGGFLYDKKRKLNKLLYSTLILIPFLAIYSGFVVYNSAVHVYPIAFIPLIAFPIGLFINQISKDRYTYHKYIFLIIIVALIALVSYMGMPNWLAYVFNKPKPEETIQVEKVKEIKFTNENDSTIYLNDFKGQVVVLDFWSTSCSICFKKFPEFDKLKNFYEDIDGIEIYAVNLLHKNQTNQQIKEKFNALNYSFPNLYTTVEDAKLIKSAFQFNAVPTLIIIDKNGEVYYKGNLLTAKHIIINNAYTTINKLIE